MTDPSSSAADRKKSTGSQGGSLQRRLSSPGGVLPVPVFADLMEMMDAAEEKKKDRSKSHSRSKAMTSKPEPPAAPSGSSSAKASTDGKRSAATTPHRRHGSVTAIPRLLSPNDRIGPQSFVKLKAVGSGDVGKVYLCALRGTNQIYAMKTMAKSEMIRRNKVRRVLTEREILSTSNHPFIVTLYNCFQSKHKLYFVMDYCAGGEFFRTLQKQPHKSLPEASTRFYASEVLLALEYLHMLGYVYRDLKPENILLHESGHIMLTDFDLSKAAATTTSPKIVKQMFSFGKKSAPDLNVEPEVFTNSFVGTEEYIAPEVISGLGHTTAVDWWTFGILMYEMLYGTTPYRGSSRDETFDKIMAGHLTFPDYPIISANCRSVIKKLLHPNPNKRLGSEHGAVDIKNHPFFSSINWALIRNETPPIVPRVPSVEPAQIAAAIKMEEEDGGRQSFEDLTDEEDDENPFHGFCFERQEDAFYNTAVKHTAGRSASTSKGKKK